MKLEESLKNYKKIKGKIGIITARCEYWQHCLDTMTDEEIASNFIYEKSDTYGMPKAKSNESIVERTAIIHEVTRQTLKEWIKEDKSRLGMLEYEIKQIDIALGSLTEEENFVIECKCIDNWKWKQVEIAFNEKYRKGREITEEGLKDIKENALKKMKEIVNI